MTMRQFFVAAGLLAANALLLPILLRHAWDDMQWLFGPAEDRNATLRDAALDALGAAVGPADVRPNPVRSLSISVGFIALLLWADYTTIVREWPGLLGR